MAKTKEDKKIKKFFEELHIEAFEEFECPSRDQPEKPKQKKK